MNNTLQTHGSPFLSTLTTGFCLTWITGCLSVDIIADERLADPEIETGEVVSTVSTVRWESADCDDIEAYVEFGRDSNTSEYRAPAKCVDGDSLVAVLIGMKADTDYMYRIVEESEAGTMEGGELVLTTGSLPPELPRLQLDEETYRPDLAGGGFLLTAFIPSYPVILDADGDVVWWADPGFETPHGMNRLVLSEDGSTLLYHAYTTGGSEGNYSDERWARRVALDGTLLQQIPLPMSHHDLTELPDGTLAVLMYDPVEIDGETVDADRLVEVAPDGTETDIWSTWGSVAYDSESVPGNGVRWGHCNAVRYDATEDVYYVGCRHFNTIFKIDRQTGDVLWQIGRTDSDFTIASGDEEDWFENQHQFRILDGRLVVFDNGVQGGVETAAAEYSFDTETWEAELLWRYQPDPPFGIYALGDVHRFESGNTLIAWSTAGRLEEVAPEGTQVRKYDFAVGTGLGYLNWLESLYPNEM